MKNNPQIALAVRTIGQGFIALADALATPMVEGDEPTAPAAAAETPAPRKRTRSPDKPKPVEPEAEEPEAEQPEAEQPEAEEPAADEPEAEEPESPPVKLVHIQEAAQALLAGGKRNDLLAILKKHGIAKASAAPKETWVELLVDLEAPLNG